MISVVTACPPLPNPGMATVELGVAAFFRRCGLLKDVRMVQLYSPDERNPTLSSALTANFRVRQHLPINHFTITCRADLLNDGGPILYCGDFLHSREYLLDVADSLHGCGRSQSFEEALELCKDLLFLRDSDEDTLQRTIAFGGSLIFNRHQDYLDPAYSDLLHRFFGGIRLALMRDVYSAQKLMEFRTPNECTLGVDAATLLRREDLMLLGLRFEGKPRLEIAVFIGRSEGDVTTFARFCSSLTHKLGMQARWLSWFDPHYLPSHYQAFSQAFPEMLPPESANPSVVEILQTLAESVLVVSDTYHVCVNAWTLGVPAICIATSSPKEPFDISSGHRFAWRDKRQVFYAMHDAMDYFVQSNDLADPNDCQAYVEHASVHLQDTEAIASLSSLIRSRADLAEHQLVRALTQIISES